MKIWKHWKYKNLTLVALGIIFAVILLRIEEFQNFLLHLGRFGYISAFFAGILFVSTFTVATGAVILLILAEQFHPVEIGLIAGLGALVGDITIFRFVKDNLSQELESLYNQVDNDHHFTRVLHSKYFSWSLPVIGAIIIASPFPDEVGISLMGLSKINVYKFMLISFLLNSIGIFLVVSIAVVI